MATTEPDTFTLNDAVILTSPPHLRGRGGLIRKIGQPGTTSMPTIVTVQLDGKDGDEVLVSVNDLQHAVLPGDERKSARGTEVEEGGPQLDYWQELDDEHFQSVVRAADSLLRTLGLPLDNQHFRETPKRMAQALLAFRTPAPDLTVVLGPGFEPAEGEDKGLVFQSKIPLRTLCPHHMLPVLGHATVAYIPRQRILGLSKLARLTDAAGTRYPITQEQLTNDVADAIMQGIDAIGTAVVTKAMHCCMSVRGVQAPGVYTTVSVMRGAFFDRPEARSEFFALMHADA